MQRSRSALLALSAMALMGTGASVVSPAPAQPTASASSATQPGNPMLAVDTAQSPHDRRQWLRSRRTPSRYRSLRRSTGTHKQNRRRLLAGKR